MVSRPSDLEQHPSPNYLHYDTIILCNPNAMSYQHLLNYPQCFYLKYFLDKKINCLVWNYRGYGRTKGMVSPNVFQKDAEQVLNFLKLKLRVKGKIGVYGRSLGCIPVCHIQHQVDLAIADRGFGDLWTIAEKTCKGQSGISLMTLGTPDWQIQNGFNFLRPNKRRQTYKLIMQDRNDELVDLSASLMVDLAKQLCHNQSWLQEGKVLPAIIDDYQAELFIQACLSIIDLDHEIHDIIEDCKESLEKEEEDADSFDSFGKRFNLRPKNDSLKFYLKLGENLSMITDAICSQPRAGIIVLGEICNSNRPVSKAEIHEWLMMLQVWGSYQEMAMFTLEECRMLGHMEIVKCAEKLMMIRNEVIAMLKAHEVYKASYLLESSLIHNLGTIIDIFEVIISKLTLLFNGEKNVDPSNKENLKHYMLPHVEQVGHLAKVEVGHSATFQFSEEI